MDEADTKFVDEHSDQRPDDDVSALRAVVMLVHGWRRFPFVHPELPTELLPERWGATATGLFRERHALFAGCAAMESG